jgi:hypothetical protein
MDDGEGGGSMPPRGPWALVGFDGHMGHPDYFNSWVMST